MHVRSPELTEFLTAVEDFDPSPPQPLVTTTTLSVSLSSAFLAPIYKWGCAVFVFLWLISLIVAWGRSSGLGQVLASAPRILAEFCGIVCAVGGLLCSCGVWSQWLQCGGSRAVTHGLRSCSTQA